MTGAPVLETVRQTIGQHRMLDDGDTVLVAVTGYGRDEDRSRSREAGFDHHLVKPVSFEALNGVFGLVAQRMQTRCPSPSAAVNAG